MAFIDTWREIVGTDSIAYTMSVHLYTIFLSPYQCPAWLCLTRQVPSERAQQPRLTAQIHTICALVTSRLTLRSVP